MRRATTSCCVRTATTRRYCSTSVEYLPAAANAEPIVVLHFDDLVARRDLSASIAASFGFEGLGILAVAGVPGFEEARSRLLPLSREFAALPEEVKAATEQPDAFYAFGWSHGKEKMMKGVPDIGKGSYYANPQYDAPFGETSDAVRDWPAFAQPNTWPEGPMPKLRPAFMDAGTLMVDVGVLVAAQCDAFVSSVVPSYSRRSGQIATGPNFLEGVISRSRVAKGRLLHYYGGAQVEDFRYMLDDSARAALEAGATGDDVASWCGWHNDHGSLTALIPAMFLDEKGDEVDAPDSDAGLYIKSRKGTVVKAAVPPSCIAFQIGETAMIHSGGALLATPHCVRGPSDAQDTTSRETFAVFMEPEWGEPMDVPFGMRPEDAMKGSSHEYLPEGVPLLERRWIHGQSFGDFTEKTLSSYYT